MRICEEAEREKESKLATIEIYGAYYGHPAIGVATLPIQTLFSPSTARHEWVIVTTRSGSIFCIEFTRSGETKTKTGGSKPEVVISHHPNKKSANEAGAHGIGNGSYHNVQQARPTDNSTLEDVINYIRGLDLDYNLVTNNCQDLAAKLYAKYAVISFDELSWDRQRCRNTPGFSRGIDGSVNIMCNIS